MLANKGYAIIKHAYNEDGKETDIWYFNDKEKPVEVKGVHHIIEEYDKTGNVSKESYQNADGKPILNNFGYAFVKKEYNENGKVIRESYFGISDEAVQNKLGASVTSFKYDEDGNKIEEAYYDTDGNLINNNKGFARIVMEYSENGEIKTTYYDADGEEVKID